MGTRSKATKCESDVPNVQVGEVGEEEEEEEDDDEDEDEGEEEGGSAGTPGSNELMCC